MRFADVLPHLEAGRRVRRAAWVNANAANLYVSYPRGTNTYDSVNPDSYDLLASDWEVVEEPAPAKPATHHCKSCGWDDCHVTIRDLRANVTRLTEWTARDDKAIAERDATIARLTREAAGMMDNVSRLQAQAAIDRSEVARLTRERGDWESLAKQRLEEINRLDAKLAGVSEALRDDE